MRILYSVVALLVMASMANAQVSGWFRGNTHSHTLNSDGDSPPDSVARWYRDRGYQFLFITDHEKLTDPAPLNARYGAPGLFLLIRGQEVTQRVADSTHPQRVRQAHVNALGAFRLIMPLGPNGLAAGINMRAAYDTNITNIRAAGGIAQVNHPNFRWSVRLDDLLALPDSILLEVANAHTGVNNQGDGEAAPSAEALWDSLLTRRKVVFAVGDDDSHSFKPANADDHEETRPGRAWIMVRADTLTEASILGGIRRGDFYVSTGVTLSALSMSAREIRVTAIPRSDSRFTTELIGSGGKLLATVSGAEVTYRPRGDEGYVRARVTDSNGRMALTQAFFLASAPGRSGTGPR